MRTIYDEGGNTKCVNEYENEKNDIIETFKKACEDIVDTSQKNMKETQKIDFVFVTKSYLLSDYEANVSDEVSKKIGNNPMDNTSEDWFEFVDNTNNLQEADEYDMFETDYGNYPLICMASSKNVNTLKCDDIIKENVPALYERKRNKISVTNSCSLTQQKVNKIKAMNSYFKNTLFAPIEELPENAITFVGDNWYIIYNNGTIEDSCLLNFDKMAKIEFNETQKNINQYISKNNQMTNINDIANNFPKKILIKK